MNNNFEDIPVRPDLQAVAFYNTENLFDTFNNKSTNDNDFLPKSAKNWTTKRYNKKLRKLSYVISNIGRRETGKHPAIVGLAEVENAKVIKDLLAAKHLEPFNYGYIHFDSADERGIDVALLYDKDNFQLLHAEPFSIELKNDKGLPDYTRDILLVSGLLEGEKTHFIVNHWSSRREGEKETEHKRIASSDKVGEIISNLKLGNPEAKIIVMGDFNDDPSSNTIKRLVDNFDLFNPMATLRSYTRGTSKHYRKWNLFDQFLITNNYFKTSKNAFEFSSANIFDERFLKIFQGKYKGSPYRTYVGQRYKGGYSDHFPVYVVLKK